MREEVYYCSDVLKANWLVYMSLKDNKVSNYLHHIDTFRKLNHVMVCDECTFDRMTPSEIKEINVMYDNIRFKYDKRIKNDSTRRH